MTFPELYEPAHKSHIGSLHTVGTMKPCGITLHYTADDKLSRAVSALREKGLAYHIIIDRDGTVYQYAKFTDQVWHAGRAIWNMRSPNHCHIAVSLVSWGLVERLANGAYMSWAHRAVPGSEVVERYGKWWHGATVAQESALLTFLTWATARNIPPEDICGHSECALPTGRKADPGGILSVSEPELRKMLISSMAEAI